MRKRSNASKVSRKKVAKRTEESQDAPPATEETPPGTAVTEKRKLNLWVDVELWKKFAHLGIETRRNITEHVTQAMLEYLERQEILDT